MAYTPYQEQTFQTRFSLTAAPTAVHAFVSHPIAIQISDDGDSWQEDIDFSISVPAADLEAVLAMNSGAAKVQAYKQLLKENVNTRPQANFGKSDAAIQQRANAAARAAAAAAGSAAYIATIKPDYPVNFTL